MNSTESPHYIGPEEMAKLQPPSIPKPLSEDELQAKQVEAAWQANEPNAQQTHAEQVAAWHQHEKEAAESKLVEARLLQHAAEKEAQEIATASHLDTLTQLPNKEYFENWLESRIAEDPHDLWVGFIDLDHFKKINTLVGHDRADVILQNIANLLQSQVREDQDVITSRRSGDEFLIGIEGATPERVEEIARNIMQVARSIGIAQDGRLVPVIGQQGVDNILPIHLSIGFVRWHEGVDSSALLKKANFAMYEAKEAGRNQYIIQNGD